MIERHGRSWGTGFRVGRPAQIIAVILEISTCHIVARAEALGWLMAIFVLEEKLKYPSMSKQGPQ